MCGMMLEDATNVHQEDGLEAGEKAEEGGLALQMRGRTTLCRTHAASEKGCETDRTSRSACEAGSVGDKLPEKGGRERLVGKCEKGEYKHIVALAICDCAVHVLSEGQD